MPVILAARAGVVRGRASRCGWLPVGALSVGARCVREPREACRDAGQPLFRQRIRVLRRAQMAIAARLAAYHQPPAGGQADRLANEVLPVTDGSAGPHRGRPGRSTRQKRALTAILDASDGFRSARDLFTELRSRGVNVGLTTVYNQLRALADGGEVDALRAGDGKTRYRRCATGHHHHHLVCRQCGRATEVEGDETERWAEQVASSHGFSDVTHTVEILGTCGQCAAGMPAGT